MRTGKRVLSSLMLGTGVVLMFAGLSASLGFTPGAMLASAAAIATLLYAGATWFAPPAWKTASGAPVQPLIVFDRTRRIVAGPAAGQTLASQFPELVRGEIERRSVAALTGNGARFLCFVDDRPVMFDALPVRNIDGAVEYGILVRTESVSPMVAASA